MLIIRGSGIVDHCFSNGQNFGPHDDGTLSINGNTLATGGIFQGLAPAAPGAGVSNGDLTDVETFDLTPSLTPGMNNLNIQLTPGTSDAISLIAAAFAVPAGAAPPPPPSTVTPEPSSMVLLATGAMGVVGLLRRRVNG